MASLKDILGSDNITPFGNALLTDTTTMTNLPLSKIQKCYFTNLQKASGSPASPLYPHISVEDMTSGFRKWKESTTTSPSHRHLGHYKSFLVSDSNDENPEHIAFGNTIL